MVKNRRLTRLALCAVTALAACCLAMPALAVAADAQVASQKDETVYVYTAADGSVRKSEVSVVLKNPDGAEELADASNLSGIEGKDDVAFSADGSSIVWHAGGKDVEYTGATTTACPVSVHVTYKLDGNAIAPDQLPGKSGHVAITYEFSNASQQTAGINGSSQSVYTPFTCITALMLDGDDFKNVKVSSGKIINDGSDTIVMGLAMPGLKQSLGSMADGADIPESFTVEADAVDFNLKSAMTIVTAGLMSDLDGDSLGLSGVDDASALTDAMNELISGSDTLGEGLDTLSSSIEQVEDGTSALASGAGSVSEGVGSLADGLPRIASGIREVSSGIEDAAAAVDSAKDSLSTTVEKLNNANVDADKLATAIAYLQNHKEDFTNPDEYEAIMVALNDSAQMSGTVSVVSEQLSSSIGDFDALSEGLKTAASGASTLASKTDEAAAGATALYDGATQLEAGATQLDQAMPALAQGAQAAAEGSDKLTEGMRQFNNEGVSKLVDTLENEFGGMLDRMNALSDAAKSYTNFSGITPGTTGSVKFVLQTDPISKD